MKFNFRHPVLAGGEHPGTGVPRTFVGLVETPVEIEEMSSADVELAFTLCREQTPIFRLDGLLYHPSPDDLQSLVDGSLSGTANKIDRDEYCMRGFPRRFTDAARRAPKGGPDSLFPQPRGWSAKALEDSDTVNVMRWASATGSLAARKPVQLEDEDVETWRETARRFFANFLIVDGRTMTRCHEPIYLASSPGVFVRDFSYFRSHVDDPAVSSLGFPSGKGMWWTDMNPFPADALDEAIDFCRSRGWHTDGHDGGIVVHGSCASLSAILDEELIRHAGFHATLGQIIEREALESDLMERVAPMSSALLDLRDQAAAYREREAAIEGLETAVENFASAVAMLPADFSGFKSYERARQLCVDTAIMMARRDDAPISAPRMSLR